MNNYRNGIDSDKGAFVQLVMFFVFTLAGFLMASSLGQLIMELFNLDMTRIGSLDESESTKYWWVLMTSQGLTSFLLFILTPYLYLVYYLKTDFRPIRFGSDRMMKGIMLTLATTFSFMIVNSFFVEWNQNIDLPDSLQVLEDTLSRLEESLAELTMFITDFSSIPQLLMALLVVAVLPAIGEEFFFRGVLQTIMQKLTGNPHVAIWVTGILFGAFHLQFYGVVPRSLLGIIFGYLFYYSGNLLYPMIAHFLNNGLSLILMFLFNRGLIGYDIEDAESLPISSLLIFSAMFIISIIAFVKHFNQKPSNG